MVWTRMLLGLSLVALITGPLAGWSGLAQGAAPVALDSLGYAELLVQVSDDGFMVPGQVTAGRTLITLQNTGEESRHSSMLRLPETLTIQDLFAGAESDAPPPSYFASTFVGFPGEVLPGQQTQAVVDLTPGLYLILDDFVAPVLVVPAGEAATPSEPPAQATVILSEFAFAIPDDLVAGPQVWRVENPGVQPHELLLTTAPDGTTVNDVIAHLTEDELSTPNPDGISSDDLIPVGGLGSLSSGGVGWTLLDLQPGTYVALCFFPDMETMSPHAFMGMIEVFTVAG